VTRPRAADDFATIRARMEELRRERAQAGKAQSRDPESAGASGRGVLRGADARRQPDQERWPAGLPSRRYGSGR
jgi:hypothetical protein